MLEMKVDRRSFIKASALAGGGLLMEMSLSPPAVGEDLGTLVGSRELNAYIKIASNGEITIFSSIPEMGQGIRTTLPMVVAEEMGASWDDVVVIDAPVDGAIFGLQGAGGSTSVPLNFDKMRKMGASAREMLIGAAAEALEVKRDELEAKESQIVHVSGVALTFGQLAAAAVRQPLPDQEFLSFKDPRSYTIIGKAINSVDNLIIATGRSEFGIDVDVPGMKYASYSRCPNHGGKALSFNEAEIKELPGITDAFIVKPDSRAGNSATPFLKGFAALQGGVAIVGEDTFAVFYAKSKLQVEWDESDASRDDWLSITAQAKKLAEVGGATTLKSSSAADAAFTNSENKQLEGFYEFPFVAHICMEPMNCTAHYKTASNGNSASMEVWVPSQFPEQVKEIASNLLGISPENTIVHGTRMGGGFGRRAAHDFVSEAMIISKIVGEPVKLTWTRTDDIHHDFFRVGGFEHFKGAVTPEGKLAGLQQHYIGFGESGKPVVGSGLRGNELTMSVLDQAKVVQTLSEIKTPCGAWRAPGSNTNAFCEQGFLDELAVLAGRNYADFLIELLGEPRWLEEGNVRALNTGRAVDVIKLAVEESGYGKRMAAGKGQGLAFYFCHAAHIAEVADVTVNKDNSFAVDRVTVAVDVGPIINMSGAMNQVEGSIIDGLSTMAMQEITITDGVIQEDNFDEYEVMRIDAAPKIDVYFIQSANAPTGLGEPALPPLAPAVANAIYAAVGRRVRTMPLSKAGFRLV